MTTDSTTLIETIQKLAPTIAAEHAALTDALAERDAAKAALLDRVVALVRPALRALSSRVKVGSWGISGEGSGGERHAGRGLLVSEGPAGPVESKVRRDDFDGTYSGYDLFIGEDGSWREVSYEGSWSHWQGARCEWKGISTTLTTAQVVAEYDVDTIIAQIADACGRQVGKRGEQTKAARERADRLKALAALL